MDETNREREEQAGIEYIKRSHHGNIGAQMVSLALLKDSIENNYPKEDF